MNHPDVDVLIQQVRRNDDLKAAKSYRLVREALRYRQPRRIILNFNPIMVSLAQIMAWLGNLLTNWSCRLQSRYVVPVTSAPSDPCLSQ